MFPLPLHLFCLSLVPLGRISSHLIARGHPILRSMGSNEIDVYFFAVGGYALLSPPCLSSKGG